ncbi:energy transducer TonB [Pedobacter arcticus]|uniref:energy transducer TonB n=1 Tax=Pedobacter arcticus TaxID=752140 RepID=UPI0002E4674B|nr:energy transducer TonB [Pedobacter arcticus]
MNWTSYLIQANLYLVLFYTFYRLVLRKETFFNLNRYYLLFVAFASGLIPLIKITWFSQTAQPVQQQFVNVTAIVMDGYASPVKDSWTLGDILTLVYFGVVLLMSIRLIYKLIKLNLILKDKNQPEAFSFFQKIRINSNLPQQTAIEKHELTHARQLHSADVLFFEILSIINWFNPIIYCFKNSIKHIHEFIADEAVLKTETDKTPYVLLLLSKTFGVSPHTLTNNFFNKSLLKRRIEMMNKTKSRKTAIIKYGLSAPLFLLALVLSSAKISKSKMINSLSETIKPERHLSEIIVPGVASDFIDFESIRKPNRSHTTLIVANLKTKTTKTDSVVKPHKFPTAIREVSVNQSASGDTSAVFTNVEVLPSFPGGIQAFGQFLSSNLVYPKGARDANIQGRVFCQFIVEKDGSLSTIKVVRGIGGGCDEEAVRVLAISPKWNSGVQKGKIVRVSYTIPIFFQIKEDKVESIPFSKLATPPPPPIEIPSDNKALFIINGKDFTGDKDKLKEDIKSSIETINVLKGEAATKKYGDKGKNGVIEITTKKK